VYAGRITVAFRRLCNINICLTWAAMRVAGSVTHHKLYSSANILGALSIGVVGGRPL
jgi:hypothetical protein